GPSLFFHTTLAPARSTLSLHDALPIWSRRGGGHHRARRARSARPDRGGRPRRRGRHPIRLQPRAAARRGIRVDLARAPPPAPQRSEEHTSELQSRFDLVCRLLLEKKNK